MTSAQLTKWRAETTAKTVAAEQAQAASSPKTYATTGFYTGKPYLAESGSYAFKYREYNPEMARWTTVDPSGFPDGANNRAYMAVPTSQFDPDGFLTKTLKATWSEDITYSDTYWSDTGLVTDTYTAPTTMSADVTLDYTKDSTGITVNSISSTADWSLGGSYSIVNISGGVNTTHRDTAQKDGSMLVKWAIVASQNISISITVKGVGINTPIGYITSNTLSSGSTALE